jgi:hypothetical protein
MDPRVYVEPADVERRLGDLGLSVDIIRQAVVYGQMHRDTCTLNDPPGLPGILAWGRTIRSFGEQLVPRGWERRDDFNLSAVVNPEGDLAIVVSTGDDGTGLADLPATTKYRKGPATVAAVEVNAYQLDLFDLGRTVVALAARRAPRITWMLLIARVGDQIRCELSLPSIIADDGRVERWEERIILPPFDLGPVADELPEDDGGDIDMEIARRKRS